MLAECPFAIEGRTPLWWRWSTASTLALVTLAASCLTLRGLAGWSSPPDRRPRSAARSFQLPQLTIGQREHDDQPFDLRFRLPDRFTLTFEVMAEPADLPGSKSSAIGSARPPTPRRPATAYRLWHRVQIRRAGAPRRSRSTTGRSPPTPARQARHLADDPPLARPDRPHPRPRARLVSDVRPRSPSDPVRRQSSMDPARLPGPCRSRPSAIVLEVSRLSRISLGFHGDLLSTVHSVDRSLTAA